MKRWIFTYMRRVGIGWQMLCVFYQSVNFYKEIVKTYLFFIDIVL